MQWWAQIVPVMNGSGFFSVMSRRAARYSPRPQSSMYSGMSCPMGQPPLQGAVKQSSSGTASASLRGGSGFTGLRYFASSRAARESAATASTSTWVKGLYSQAVSVSAICVMRA